MSMELRGTTICAVRKNGHTSIAGDGQVTMGQSVIFKSHAHKVRRLYGGQVVIGFAGAVADAFTLCDKFEEKLTQCGGNLERAAVALAQMWRSDSGMRQLETQMIVADKDTLLVVSGTGEVIDPDEGVVAIGSGGNYALAAARALVQNTDLSAHDIGKGAAHRGEHLRVHQRQRDRRRRVRRGRHGRIDAPADRPGTGSLHCWSG